MQDPFAAMLGLGLGDDEQARLMAEQLRNRDQAAAFFASTTVPQIAQGAQAERQLVQDAANRGGTLVNARRQREFSNQQQQDRFAESERVRALQRTLALQDEERLRKQQQEDRYQEELGKDFTTYVDPRSGKTTQVRIVDGDILNAQGIPVDINNLMKASEYEALMKRQAGGAGTGYGAPGFEYTTAKTAAEREYENKVGEDLRTAIDLADAYDPVFRPNVPLTGRVENFVGEYLPSTDTAERQADWWKMWKNKQELVQRHKMFGSALTKSEQEEWRRATIGPDTKPEIIQKYLGKMKNYSQRLAEAEAARMIIEGRDPTMIQQQFGPLLGDISPLIEEVQSGAYRQRIAQIHAQDAARRQQRGVSDDTLPTMDDVPLNELSLEELRRMAEEQ